MSVKLYTVRIPKDRWWEFSAAVRATYLNEYPGVEDFHGVLARGATYSEAMASIEVNTHFVELQLFDEGDTWLVRPLEQGWFFINHVEEKAWPGLKLKKVFYDNRADVPKRDKPNKAVADWVNTQILERRYLVFPVLDRAVYQSLCTATWRGDR